MNICSVRWTTPASILIAGPSGSGKTHFLYNLLKVKDKIFEPAPQAVIYFYKIYQSKYDAMKKDNPSIFFIDQLPQNLESFKSLVEPHKATGSIVVFDDYEEEIVKNIGMFKQIWTVLSHHLNTTPIAVLHNLFAKDIRTISINTHRVVLTRSVRDSSQISFLSRQCYPTVKNFLPSVYSHCMKLLEYPYLVLNFSPGRESDNYIKVCTRIFENEQPMAVFRENDCYTGKGGSPYEKLVLINQDLYRFLTKGEDFHKNTSDLKYPQQVESAVSNTNKVEITNDVRGIGTLGQEARNTLSEREEYPNKKSEAFSRNPWDNRNVLPALERIDDSNKDRLEDREAAEDIPVDLAKNVTKRTKFSEPSKDSTLKKEKPASFNEVRESETLPFTLPPIKELFKKSKKHSISDSSRKTLSGRVSKDISRKIPKTVDIEKNIPEDMDLEAEKVELENDDSRESEKTGKTTSFLRRSGKVLKRKAHVKTNRELHPFKASKLNKGDKRKNVFVNSRKYKEQKTKHSTFKTRPENYQKWNL